MYLEKESAFECLIKIVCKVGSGHKNAIKIFHFFKNNILYGIFSLSHTAAIGVFTLGKYCVSLIKQQDRFYFAFLTQTVIFCEHVFYKFLTFAKPTGFSSRDVNVHDSTTGSTSYLHNTFRLTCARQTIEQNSNPCTQMLFFQPCTHTRIITIIQAIS